MHVIGGTLGLGTAQLDQNGVLHVCGMTIRKEHIRRCEVLEERKIRFSILRFIGFCILISLIMVPLYILTAGLVIWFGGVISIIVIALGFHEKPFFSAKLTLSRDHVVIISGTLEEVNALTLPPIKPTEASANVTTG